MEVPILLVSNLIYKRPDEGIRKFVGILKYYVEKKGGVAFNVSDEDLLKGKFFLFWGKEKKLISKTNLILYVPSQSLTFMTLIRCWNLKRYTKGRVFLFALQPRKIRKFLPKKYLPDLVFVSNPDFERYLKIKGFKTVFFPMGVDGLKYSPVSQDLKKKLKTKFGLSEDKPLILHVGHISPGRNLEDLIFLKLNLPVQIWVVGSPSTKIDKKLLEELEGNKIMVTTEFFENIHEIYRMSDVYVFPVKSEGNAIGVPLSVLEAMATNLPVVTTRFGGLPYMFNEGKGLFFYESREELVEKTKKALECREVGTREMVLNFSWDRLLERTGVFHGF